MSNVKSDRCAGVLLPVSSLPSAHGIGTFGKAAYEWIDQLAEAKLRYWQVLPLGPVSYGDSPYQSFSAFAGNPYYVDLDVLKEEGLLTEEDIPVEPEWVQADRTNYEWLHQTRFEALRKACASGIYQNTEDYETFRGENRHWLPDYALFMALKLKFDYKNWMEWPDEIRMRRPLPMIQVAEEQHDEVGFWEFVQYCFFRQWKALKEYAAENKVEIIGDIPIYCAMDSADVWSHPELFQMDEDIHPVNVAGCPPDAFSADGQLWGNPLYRWDVHASTGFAWWKSRMQANAKLFDCIRVDHFIGIVRYYSIPATSETAKTGWYTEGPGDALIQALREAVPECRLIAEDLGVIVPEVREALQRSGLPGMKVLEFAFGSGSDNEYLPHNYKNSNSIVYVGTHDNDTAAGYLDNLPEETREEVYAYLGLEDVEDTPAGVNALMRTGMASVADTCILQAQDLLGLGNEARINLPSTTGANWQWRLTPGQLTEKEWNPVKKWVKLYGRE